MRIEKTPVNSGDASYIKNPSMAQVKLIRSVTIKPVKLSPSVSASHSKYYLILTSLMFFMLIVF